MSTLPAGWKSFESCTRQQLLTTAYALEDTRDRALAENAVLRTQLADLQSRPQIGHVSGVGYLTVLTDTGAVETNWGYAWPTLQDAQEAADTSGGDWRVVMLLPVEAIQ